MKNWTNRFLLGALALVGSGAAVAAGPDYSDLTDAINFETISPIVLGAGAALLTLYVIIKGVRIVIGMVRGS